MSAYEALAASYDGLTRDIPYERILRFWHSLLQRHGKTPHTVLDLACGTGSGRPCSGCGFRSRWIACCAVWTV